jgi:REP-associated tyrosine transposase
MIAFTTQCGTSNATRCAPTGGPSQFCVVRGAKWDCPLLRGEHWPWSSLALATRSNVAGTLRVPSAQGSSILADWPLPRPADWLQIVNRPQSEPELEALRKSANRGCPLGEARWTATTARLLGIEFTLRTRGRPKQRA